MYIEYLSIEATRRCNMACAHCLRGPARDEDMGDDIAFWTAKLLSGATIGTLTLSGGEPSLAVETIRELKKNFIWNNIDVQNLSVITNNKNISDEFLEVIAHWMAICSNGESSALSYSSDHYHEEKYKHGHDLDYRWGQFSNVRLEPHTEGPIPYLLNMGNAYGSRHHGVFIRTAEMDYIQEGLRIREVDLHINVHGDVFPSCNLSYNVQENSETLLLGNVKDESFNLEDALIEFNERIGHRSFYVTEHDYEFNLCA